MQHTLRFSSLAAVLSLFALLLIPHSAHAATITVTMTDDQFTPSVLTVNPGDTVTWVNHGSMSHTVTADNGTFDSGTILAGQQYSVTFNQAGTYAYHCKFHGSAGGVGMAGTITVAGGTGNTAGGTLLNTNTNTNTNVNSSGNNAALYAQVQALLAQISLMQAQNGGTGSSGTVPVYTGATGISSATPGVNSSACPNIGRALSLGSSGDDVTRLQQFLARDTSVYPEGTVSGYYGALTQAAVQRWQTKYNIVSSGTPASTGFGTVGPRTAAAISLQCSTMNGSTGNTGGTVGGYIQVTPITGSAPLTVNVSATVNTNGCGGATYILNFGDGTATQQIVVAGGNCSAQQQTYQHTYIYGGTYQVTLSAGSHTSSAQVTVSGPAAPTTPTTPVTPTQPTGTISAFTTSGNAPLNVNFYVSCANGSAYNVVFGDGTDLGGTAVSGTKCGTGSLDSVAHTYTSAGNYQAQLIIFWQQSTGTVVPVTSGSVNISVGSVSANYSYNPPQLIPGASQLAFSVQFDVPTACTGYDVSWGDGTADSSRADGGSSCSQTTTLATASHTYAQTGQYTITVRRGATLARSDTIAVTVQ